METQILMLLAICGLFSVSEAITCYKCLRHEVGILDGGDAEDHCEEIDDETPVDSKTDCTACVRDTYDAPGYDYLKRYCWTEPVEDCKTGEVEQAIANIDGFDSPKYTLERKCCTEEKCNKEFWDADSSTSGVKLAGSLLAAILMSLYFCMH